MVLIVGSAALNYFEMVHNVGNQEIEDFFKWSNRSAKRRGVELLGF